MLFVLQSLDDDTVGIGTHLCGCYSNMADGSCELFTNPILHNSHKSMICYTSVETMPRLYLRLLENVSEKTCL